MKSRLRQYRGPLSPAEIANGIAVAQQNALRLIEDAQILADAGRYPSANALAILAIEERGKVFILRNLALAKEEDEIRKIWREYRSHRSKNKGWIIPTLISQGARSLQQFTPAVDSDAEHAHFLDHLKQISIYTDCLGDKNWSIPEKVIDQKLTRLVIDMAMKMWGRDPVSTREIELWSQIVGPHNDEPSMIEAVLRWQAAMVDEGLSGTSVEKLAAFFKG